MTINSTLAAKRKASELTQQGMADRIGVKRSAYCQIENGRKLPSLPVALAISKTLGCTVNELFGELTN